MEREDGVAHYTSKNVAEKLLFGNRSPLRFSSVVSANDRGEGKALLDYLGIDEFYDESDYRAFVACFTFNHDSLNQFRLYGKVNNKEATGVSLIVKKKFFDRGDRYRLFRCIYVNIDSDMIFLGKKEEHTISKEKNGNISCEDYREYIEEKQALVKQKLYELKKSIQESEKLDNKIVSQLLLNLRHLVKGFQYKEEQECRILAIMNLSDDRALIKMNENYDGMHIDSMDISIYISSIHYGPQTENIELFKDRVKHEGLSHVKVEESKTNFRTR